MTVNFSKLQIPGDPTPRDMKILAKEVADIVVLSKAWQAAVTVKSPVMALAVFDAAYFQVVKDNEPKFNAWMVSQLMEMYALYEREMSYRASLFSWWD